MRPLKRRVARFAHSVKNIQVDPRVRVRVRVGGRWRTGTAHILEDDDPRARLRWL